MSSKSEQLGWKKFLKICLNSKNEAKLAEIFDLFITPEEKEHIATRILLIEELLSEQKTQREIAKDLNISIAKITRGSNNLKTVSKDLKKHLLSKISNKF